MQGTFARVRSRQAKLEIARIAREKAREDAEWIVYEKWQKQNAGIDEDAR